MNTPTTTQIKRTIPLRAYPGWVVREYRNGMFDAAQVNGLGLTIGCSSFVEAVAEVKAS